jgi:hypothetical protein
VGAVIDRLSKEGLGPMAITLPTWLEAPPLAGLRPLRMTEAVAGTTRLHAVIGGFHLPPPLSEDYVRRTVAELKAMNPDYVIPAHWSGERAVLRHRARGSAGPYRALGGR